MNWVRVEPELTGHENMARDIDIFEGAEGGHPGCRVYGWYGPWVSLGRFQNSSLALIDQSIPWVRRPTGGKGVLHGHDITVGLGMPFDHLGIRETETRSVKVVYRRLAQILICALAEVGIQAGLGESTRLKRSGEVTADCFGFVSPNDIINQKTQRKICGCALRLGTKSGLLQASIPIQSPLVDPREVFSNAADVSFTMLDKAQFSKALDSVLSRTVSSRPETT